MWNVLRLEGIPTAKAFILLKLTLRYEGIGSEQD